MEDVAATELLASLDVTEADAALVSWRAILIGSFHILQSAKLLDELSPLEESDALVAKCG